MDESIPVDVLGFALPYLLVFARIASLFMMAPGFADNNLPGRYRLLFALSLAVAFKNLIAFPQDILVMRHSTAILFLILQEVFFGAFIGCVARFFISVLDVLGNILGLQMGLGNATLFNPGIAAQSTVLSQAAIMPGILLFFLSDLHHALIQSIILSYTDFPLGASLHESLMPLGALTGFFSKTFALACRLSLPFLILGFLFQSILGLLNRVVPSIQVFFIALPLQIFLGFVLICVIFGYTVYLSIDPFWRAYQEFFPGALS